MQSIFSRRYSGISETKCRRLYNFKRRVKILIWKSGINRRDSSRTESYLYLIQLSIWFGQSKL